MPLAVGQAPQARRDRSVITNTMAIHPHDKLGFRERRRLTISVLTR
jgi:hypothetical protein